MNAVLSSIVFPRIFPSYNETLSDLLFVTRKDDDDLCSIGITHRIPVRIYNRKENKPMMLMCHGNGEDIGAYNPINYANLYDVNVCVFDYPGYGMHSNNSASEEGCQQDALTVYHYLVNDLSIDPNKIIIYGRSLGTAIACYLTHYLCTNCDELPPLGLILVSPMMSVLRIVMDHLLAFLIPGDMLMNYIYAPSITCPTLIVHGNKDTVVPYSCGQQLSTYFTNLDSFVTIEDCGHNDIYCDKFQLALRSFIHRITN